MNPDGGGYAIIYHAIASGTAGAKPLAGLTEGTDGSLYGTASVSDTRFPLGGGAIYAIDFLPILTGINVRSSTAVITGRGIPGKVYQPQRSPALGPEAWSPLGVAITASTNGVLTFSDKPSEPAAYYRVVGP